MLVSRPVLRRVAGATAAALAVGIVPFVAAAPTASAAPTELFISEYVEGSSFNKAVEIYNGTGSSVDLAAAGYSLRYYSNGSATATNVALTGTVASGDVFVFAHSSAAAPILAAADQTSGLGLWNGDDAIALAKSGNTIDVLGQIGVDPGTEWGSGLTSTADNTLRRKASVIVGDTNGGDAFDPSVQWDGYAVDTFDGLGSHTVDTGPVDGRRSDRRVDHPRRGQQHGHRRVRRHRDVLRAGHGPRVRLLPRLLRHRRQGLRALRWSDHLHPRPDDRPRGR